MPACYKCTIYKITPHPWKRIKQMFLPFFNLFPPVMSINDPSKSRRQKLEVPIHGVSSMKQRNKLRVSDENLIRTQQFDNKPTENCPQESGSHLKQRIKVRNEERHDIQQIESLSHRLSRRHLSRENTKLIKENEQIIAKFNELEELSVKKIVKLKEKIDAIQSRNEEVIRENDYLKGQTQELASTIEELKFQLEIAKKCKTCNDLKACIDKLNGDNNSLRSTKKELEEDLNMLKTVVFRLNLQLERYQEKCRKFNIKIHQSPVHNQENYEHIITVDDFNNFHALTETHQDHSHTPISWGKVNVHTLGPLLDAYQDTISEKEDIIQNYEKELSIFTGKLKEILKENEQLRRILDEDDECSTKLKVEVDNLKKELKTAREQNDILIKKCALKQDKLDEVLKCYEAKIEQLKRDYRVVHDQYYASRTEVAALKEKNKSLEDAQNEFKNERQSYIPVSVHTASVNECKKWYEELKSQYEQEKSKHLKLIDEQHGKIVALIKDKEELDNKIKQLERHIKKDETRYLELEHTLNQVQLSRSACRKQLHKAMSFAKDLVGEQETLLKALNQRQQENKVVKKIGCDIATRMDTLRNQLKDVQKDAWQELTTVEKRIQEQHDAIETMKQEHNQEIERLKGIIKEQEQTHTLLKEQTALPTPHYLLFSDKYK